MLFNCFLFFFFFPDPLLLGFQRLGEPAGQVLLCLGTSWLPGQVLVVCSAARELLR